MNAPSLDLVDPNDTYRSASSYPLPAQPMPSSSNAASALYGSMAISSIGAIVSAFGQARAAKAQGDYEASISRTNAMIAGLQSKQALETGDIEASRKELLTQQQIGSERAVQGASGTDVNTGSNRLVQLGTDLVGKTDELTIRNNAARQAWGFQTEAITDSYKGQFAKLTGKASSEESLLSGGLTAVSAPLAIEANYLRFSRYMGGGGGGGPNVPYPSMAT